MLRAMRPSVTIPNAVMALPNAVVAVLWLVVLASPAAFGATNEPATTEVQGPAAPDQGSPAEVTTDTAAYCALLAAKMDQETDASFDAIALGAQGKELCAMGEIRPGIARLRRALLSAREDGYDDEVTMPSVGGGATAPSGASDQFPTIMGSDGADDGSVIFPPRPLDGRGGPPSGGGPPGGGRGREGLAGMELLVRY